MVIMQPPQDTGFGGAVRYAEEGANIFYKEIIL